MANDSSTDDVRAARAPTTATERAAGSQLPRVHSVVGASASEANRAGYPGSPYVGRELPYKWCSGPGPGS